MPISKKPRSKPALRTSTKTSALAALPDRRAMVGFLAIAGHGGGDATAKAQDVIYDAWERTSSRSRIALARKALGISPLCADAYVLLAEEARSIEEARDYYAKGVEAGELALGPRGFEQYAGHFWGFLETRPLCGPGLVSAARSCSSRRDRPARPSQGPARGGERDQGYGRHLACSPDWDDDGALGIKAPC